ncbi:MAG: hypothetical protein ACLFWM_14460 [Actinomycetota bacterium]
MAQSHRPDLRGEPPPSGVVELRVHGVGGTPPEDILDVPVTCLVGGDESAGFFRPWGPAETQGPPREAYSWGGLTSASRLRALWVLLTPFALANLAGWILRHGGDPTDTRPRRRDLLEGIAAGLTRVFGLVLTVAVAGYAALGAVDLVGRQCGARTGCTDGRWWLSPWDNRLVAGDPGRSMVVGAIVAVIAILGVAWSARRSQMSIHRRAGTFRTLGDPVLSANLNHPELWESPQVAHRLGLVHTSAALATVALTLAHPGAGQGGVSSVMVPAGWVVLAMSVLAVLRLEGVPARVHTLLLGLSALYVVLVAGVLLFGIVPLSETGTSGGGVLEVLLPVYAAATLLAGSAAFWLWRRQAQGSLRAAMMSPGRLLLSVGLVNAFGSGLLIRLADLLGRPAADGEDASPLPSLIVYPDWVGDLAVVTVLVLIVAVAAVGVVWARAGAGPSCEVLARRYRSRGGLDCGDADDRLWAREVGRAEAVARLTDRAGAVVAIVGVTVLVALAGAVLISRDSGGLGLGRWAEPLAAPASVVVGVIPVLAVVGISRLYRDRSVRRLVGMVWDVATFWPRWFHPWSPPSYAERAVPQLGHRLRALAEGGVVLSAHSQGSVLAAATLALAEPDVVRKVAFLTHGSPLTRLYARYFPEYLSPQLFAHLAGGVAGWVNLWRPTDFIGGEIRSGGVTDRMVFDPPSSRPPAPGEPRPRPLRHSHYQQTDEYREVAAELADSLRSP